MKSLVLTAMLTTLIAIGTMPVQAAPDSVSQNQGTVQTETVKSHGFMLFHANKKLAMQGVSVDGQAQEPSKTPAVDRLDFNTDNFVID